MPLSDIWRSLFGGTNPEHPPALAEITNVKATQESRVADGLGPVDLAAILRSARANDIQAYLELAEFMEERDLHYYSLLQTRKLAITGCDWACESTMPGADVDSDKDQVAAAVKKHVLESPNFTWLVADLMDAIAKGFAVSQPVWDISDPKMWTYKEFRRVDPRCFVFDVDTMTELRLKTPGADQSGDPLPPGLIIHYPRLRASVPIRGGIAMLAATTWMFKTFSVKDWMAFSEVYGMPIRVAKYEPGVTTDDEKKSIKRALANLGHDAAALMPNTVDLEILSGRTGQGTSPYLELAEYFDKQLSKGVLGQTMTSDDGSSLSQASVHEKVRQDIAQADGQNLAATVMTYVIKPFVMLNFGPKALAPICYPETDPPEDLKAWSDAAVPWVQAGLQVPAAFIRSKFAIPDPEPGEELVGGDLMRTPEEELMLGQAQPGQGQPGQPGQQPPQGQQPQPNHRLALNAQEPQSVRTAEQTVDAAMREWQPILVPYKDTIEAMANRAGSFAEFLELLKAFPETADSNEFVKQLAIAATETRIVAVGKA